MVVSFCGVRFRSLCITCACTASYLCLPDAWVATVPADCTNFLNECCICACDRLAGLSMLGRKWCLLCMTAYLTWLLSLCIAFWFAAVCCMLYCKNCSNSPGQNKWGAALYACNSFCASFCANCSSYLLSYYYLCGNKLSLPDERHR